MTLDLGAQQAQPISTVRRTTSIFSRHGPVTPTELRLPTIDESSMYSEFSADVRSERHSRWFKTKSRASKSKLNGTKSPKPPRNSRGTVLHAVPPMQPVVTTALEREMATSPNEEILSAITRHYDLPSGSLVGYGCQEAIGDADSRDTRDVGTVQKTKIRKSQSEDARIGIWSGGVFHWDDNAISHRRPREYLRQVEEEASVSTPIDQAEPASAVLGRPQLTVTIPSSRPLIADTALASMLHPIPQRMSSVAVSSDIASTLDLAASVPFAGDRAVLSSHYTHSISDIQRGNLDRPLQLTTDAAKPSRASSSSSDASAIDRQSVYSRRSSATSVEDDLGPRKDSLKPPHQHPGARGSMFSIISPVRAGVFDEQTHVPAHLDKPLPPSPTPYSARRLTLDSSTPSSTFAGDSKVLKQGNGVSTVGSPRSCVGLASQTPCAMVGGPLQVQVYVANGEAPAHIFPTAHRLSPLSPTLSQAEQELEAELSAMAQQNICAEDSHSACSGRRDSVSSIIQTPCRVPTLPRRSRKREWSGRTSFQPNDDIQPPPPRRRFSDPSYPPETSASTECDQLDTNLHRSSSSRNPARNSLAHVLRMASIRDRPTNSSTSPSPDLPVPVDGLIVVDGPTTVRRAVVHENASRNFTASAKHVLVCILATVPTLKDLTNVATVNKGMYRVYKENEMQLLRQVALNESAAAWEYRSWCLIRRTDDDDAASRDDASTIEYTPQMYWKCHRNDEVVIDSLKRLILEKCATFIRKETALALASSNHPHAQRFTDAFWRIWCFCRIFGCEQARREDLTGQLDWLKGGILAKNDGCGATMNVNMEFDINSVLLSAPEFFATANGNGLTADELYDMIEIWTCMMALLQGYHGYIEEARDVGIFDCCENAEVSAEKAEQVLEQWILYLLTLGPSAVLDMAEFLGHNVAEGFAYANAHGWTNYVPLTSNGVTNVFLKEPLSRLYQERVVAASQNLQDPSEKDQKEISRRRVASLAAEIKLARQASSYHRLPVIDMNMERSMSPAPRGNTSPIRQNSVQVMSATETQRHAPRHTLHISIPTHDSPSAPHANQRAQWSPPIKHASPSQEGELGSMYRSELQYFRGVAEDTSDYAVRAVVNLGFTPAEAREALRVTDLGDGLRVDRAVEYLLQKG